VPLPANEAERMRALRLYQVLDTASEQAFDDLTHLAATICDVPIALISLVDEHRQWFKARIGLDAAETDRDVAFCAHAILGDDVMVVEDATRDPRFADNPLVQGEFGIRFYAGAPLTVSAGLAVGTVCVVDRKPRVLSAQQLAALDIIRRTVVHLLELRRARLDLSAMTELLPVCSWCRSVKSPDGNWVDLQRYVEQVVPVTHSMCPSCFERELHKPSGSQP
jgi:GAF domain-containing protein